MAPVSTLALDSGYFPQDPLGSALVLSGSSANMSAWNTSPTLGLAPPVPHPGFSVLALDSLVGPLVLIMTIAIIASLCVAIYTCLHPPYKDTTATPTQTTQTQIAPTQTAPTQTAPTQNLQNS